MHEPSDRELRAASAFIKWALMFGGTKLALYVLLRQISKWAKDQ